MPADFNFLTSHLAKASSAEKEAFFRTLLCLSAVDGSTDETEIKYITQTAAEYDVTNLDELVDFKNEDEILEQVKIIKDRHLAMELIREMCMLSHADSVLSDEETLFIGKVGLTLGLEIEKIEQISNWIIDRIIWLEQAKLIFEEE